MSTFALRRFTAGVVAQACLLVASAAHSDPAPVTAPSGGQGGAAAPPGQAVYGVRAITAQGVADANGADSRTAALDRAFAEAVRQAVAITGDPAQLTSQKNLVDAELIARSRRWVAAFSVSDDRTQDGQRRLTVVVKIDLDRLAARMVELQLRVRPVPEAAANAATAPTSSTTPATRAPWRVALHWETLDANAAEPVRRATAERDSSLPPVIAEVTARWRTAPVTVVPWVRAQSTWPEGDALTRELQQVARTTDAARVVWFALTRDAAVRVRGAAEPQASARGQVLVADASGRVLEMREVRALATAQPDPEWVGTLSAASALALPLSAAPSLSSGPSHGACAAAGVPVVLRGAASNEHLQAVRAALAASQKRISCTHFGQGAQVWKLTAEKAPPTPRALVGLLRDVVLGGATITASVEADVVYWSIAPVEALVPAGPAQPSAK